MCRSSAILLPTPGTVNRLLGSFFLATIVHLLIFPQFSGMLPNGRRYVLFARPTIGGLAWFLPARRYYKFIVSIIRLSRRYHKFSGYYKFLFFIHRVIGASKNHDKQMKYTVLLALVFLLLYDVGSIFLNNKTFRRVGSSHLFIAKTI